MALHKTGFPKEEATGWNGYLIKAGSEPTGCVLLPKQRRLFFSFTEHIQCAHWRFIYNSNTFSIGPPAGIENALNWKSDNVCNTLLSLHKECGERCVQTRLPRWCLKYSFSNRTLWSVLIFPNFYLISSLVCCNLKVSLVVALVRSFQSCLFSQGLCMPERSPTVL